MEKVVTLFTSRDRAISEPADGGASSELAAAGGFDDLLARHALAWDAPVADLVRRGAPRARRGARRCCGCTMFHLLQTVSPNTRRPRRRGPRPRSARRGLPRARLLGRAVRAPADLTLRMPELARALLRYRLRRLPAGAGPRARAGHGGAMFPWQCGSDGREETPAAAPQPAVGALAARQLPPAAARRPRRRLQRLAVLPGHRRPGVPGRHGAELMLEIARFFAEPRRPTTRPRDRYDIRGVMGPDEYHAGYPGAPEPGIDNNAYTNVMTVWVLAAGPATCSTCCRRARREELTEELRPRPGERGALGGHQPPDARAVPRRRRHQPVRGLRAARRARLGRLPSAATATSSAWTASWRPRATRRTATRCPSRPTC